MKANIRVEDLGLAKKTVIMGILNITPDSFSDGGQYNRLSVAIDHVAKMIEEGAEIIDIGGESTRPGAEKVSLEEELARVVPVIEALAVRFEVPFSIDTYKAEVAKQAIAAGADIVNDIWGLKADPLMAQVVAEAEVPVIMMHNRDNMNYTDLVENIITDLEESMYLAKKAGVVESQMILDPGIGFAKTYEHNLQVMRHLDKIVGLGYPVLLGTSRKSMIGQALDLPANERVEGTIATVCLGISKGCQIIRVHDVKEVARAAKMMDALLGRGKEESITYG